MRRIFLVLAIVSLIATTMFSAPSAFAMGKGEIHNAVGKGKIHRDHKIVLCHNGQTITVDKHALQAHLRHGDKLGACP